jgi:hypothetical protein
LFLKSTKNPAKAAYNLVLYLSHEKQQPAPQPREYLSSANCEKSPHAETKGV